MSIDGIIREAKKRDFKFVQHFYKTLLALLILIVSNAVRPLDLTFCTCFVTCLTIIINPWD